MQPFKVKNVGESASTHGERRTDGKGQTVVTSGQAGTVDIATTQEATGQKKKASTQIKKAATWQHPDQCAKAAGEPAERW